MSDSKRKAPEKKAVAKRTPAGEPAADMAGKATRAVQDLAAQASQKAAEGVSQVKTAAGQTVQGVRNEVASVREEARQSFAQGRQAATDWERELERNVTSRPIVWMLVAGAIGFLLAIIFSDDRRGR